MGVEISFCVVNTNGRELLGRCLDAVRAQRRELAVSSEVLVLDNGSDDGSAAAVRARGEEIELIVLEQRRSKALNDSELMERSEGRYCLLLNEDSELLPGAAAALHGALEADGGAACAVAALRRPDGRPQASAWRFPSVTSALAGALMLARRNVQSTGRAVRTVDWGQSCALAVRREAAAAAGWMDRGYFVYGEEVDFQKRLAQAGWHTLYVPSAVAIHHEQLSTGAQARRRIVENARGRDRYMRTHHGRLAAASVRLLTAWAYTVRALAALVLPGHDAGRYRAHARAALWPGRGEGLREAADAYNARRSGAAAGTSGARGAAATADASDARGSAATADASDARGASGAPSRADDPDRERTDPG